MGEYYELVDILTVWEVDMLTRTHAYRHLCCFLPFSLCFFTNHIKDHTKRNSSLHPKVHICKSALHLHHQKPDCGSESTTPTRGTYCLAFLSKPFCEIQNRTLLRENRSFEKHLLISKGLWCNGLGFALDHEALFGSSTRTAFILFYFLSNPDSVEPHAVRISLKCWHMSLSAQVFYFQFIAFNCIEEIVVPTRSLG